MTHPHPQTEIQSRGTGTCLVGSRGASCRGEIKIGLFLERGAVVRAGGWSRNGEGRV